MPGSAPNGRAAASGLSPAAAARHSKFGIPVGVFVRFHGFRVVHKLFYSSFPAYYIGHDCASFHHKKTSFFKSTSD